jgi:hypothetical protein
MATAEQIKALIDSFKNGDEARFRSVTLQIAARSAKQGKGKFAEDLRAMVEKLPRQTSGPVVPIARPSKDLAGLLIASYHRKEQRSISFELQILTKAVAEAFHQVRLTMHVQGAVLRPLFLPMNADRRS